MEESAFRTVVNTPKREPQIDYEDRLMLLGSCFAENIGKKLAEYKFPVTLNPFGILFNPISISIALHRILIGEPYRKDELVQHMDSWHSLNHHGRFSKTKAEETLELINGELSSAHQVLQSCTRLFLTLGTAWVYEWNETSEVVANCHKIPAKQFTRRLLSKEEIIMSLNTAIEAIRKVNPSIHVELTVSPVRHLKDGMEENQLSKAILITSAHEVKKSLEHVTYFPAYEIMMDDLRSYRYYENDLIHPNTMAIEYIWEKFRVAWINPTCDEPMKLVKKIAEAAQHRPFDAESNSFQRFVNKQLSEIEELQKEYPFLDLSLERLHFESLRLK